MAVTIGAVTSEFTTASPERGAETGGGSGGGTSNEVKVEELRAIIRELLIEELERYTRLAVDR